MTSSGIPKPPVPTRRRSAIAQAAQTGTTTVPPTPSNSEEGTPETVVAAQAQPSPATRAPARAHTAPAPAPAPAATGLKRLGGRNKDILLTLPEEEKERMVNTINWTSQHTGITHQSRFIRYAIAKFCAELEEKFNNGDQFTPPPALDM